MDITSAVQQFEALVTSFTSHKDFTQQGNIVFKLKQKTLIDFSHNINSLVVSLFVLETSEDKNSLMFASQFIKDKLKYQFQQLNQQAIVQTHHKVVSLIRINKSAYNKVVRNNLALCLSYLYIHCYQKLGTVLEFFKNTFETQNENSSLSLGQIYYQYVFRYLDGISCQVDNKRLVIDETKREKIIQYLRHQQPQILVFINKAYIQILALTQNSQPNLEDIQPILYAFSQWIKLYRPTVQVTKQLHNHKIFQLALQSLLDEQLSQPASEIVCVVMEAVHSPDENPEFFACVEKYLFGFLKTVDKRIKDEEYNQVENFVRVFAQFGQFNGRKFINNFNENSIQFIKKMIMFTQNNLIDVFQSLTDFWQVFIVYLNQKGDDSKLTDTIANDIVVELYKTLINRIQYTSNQIQELNDISQKQLSNLHQNVQDVLERRQCSKEIFGAIGNFFGRSNCISYVLQLINACDSAQSNYWSLIQAYIFSLKEIISGAQQVTPEICMVIVSLQTLNNRPIIVSRGILKVFECFTKMKQKNEQFILRILNNLALMFSITMLSQKTGSVFQKFCQNNGDILIKHVNSIFQLLKLYPNNDSIMIGFTQVIKKNPNLLAQHLESILKGPLQQLKTTRSKKQKKSIFNRLFAVLQSIPKGDTNNLSQIIQKLLVQLLPYFLQVIFEPQDPKGDQDKIIERIVKFLKLVMRSIPEKFSKYLKQILDKFIQAYKKYPINSYVYLFQVAFTVYHKSNIPGIYDYLKLIYSQLCSITYRYLGSTEQVVNYQHLVDDFIGLNKRIITYNTRMFFESGQVKPILEFTVHCLTAGIPRVASTSSQLFEIVFMIYWSPYSRQKYRQKDKGQVVEIDNNNTALYSELKTFLLTLVPNLLRQMFKFLQTTPVQTARDNTLDCFEAVAIAFPNQNQVIWKQPINQLGLDIMTLTQRERFMQNLNLLKTQNIMDFTNAQYRICKLLYQVSTRYHYRKYRGQNLTKK